MANEITLVSGLSVTKNGVTVSGTCSKSQSMYESVDSVHHTVQDVGTGALEPVSLGDIDKSKDHIVWLRNNGTSVIRIDPGVGSGYWFSMLAGESFGPVRIAGGKDSSTPMSVIAVTDAGILEVAACEAGDPALEA